MDDTKKTKEQLIGELAGLRQRLVEAEAYPRLLQESEEKFRLISEQSLMGIAILQDDVIKYVNEACAQLTGYTVKEILNWKPMGFSETIHPEDREFVLEQGRKKQGGARDIVTHYSYRMITRTGKTKWIDQYSKTIAYGGNPADLITFIDLTERRRAEAKLREAETNFHMLVSHVGDVLYSVDDETSEFRYISPNFTNLTGYTPEDIRKMGGRPAFLRQAVQETVFAENQGKLNPQKLSGRHGRVEAWWKCKDGSMKCLEDRWVPNHEGNRLVGAIGMLRDITERKRMEQELVLSQRLRAAGELASGVSHNLNNILTGILGPVELLKMRVKNPSILRDVETIFRSAIRARDLVARLHQAVRGGSEMVESVSVREGVQDVVRAAMPRWKDEPQSRGLTVEVITRLQDVPPISGTPSGLHDMLLNLLLNALDAMPEGGTIEIASEPAGKNVRLTVSDTGTGMDEGTRRRIFEPFFTTKMEVGTGLGLSTVYNTVTRWGGSIQVNSAPGKGTAFILLIPVWEGPEPVGDTKAKARITRRAKLLVVEDEELVCEILSMMLSGDHKIEFTRSGPEALARFSKENYDVALIDLGMPKMAGDRVAEKMRKIDPALATVLITGWDLDENDPRIQAFDFQVQKPFESVVSLRTTVVQAIELHDRRISGRANFP